MTQDPFIRVALIVVAVALLIGVALGSAFLGARLERDSGSASTTQTAATITATSDRETYTFSNRAGLERRIMRVVSGAETGNAYTSIRCFRLAVRAAQCVLHIDEGQLPSGTEIAFVHCESGAVDDPRNSTCTVNSA